MRRTHESGPGLTIEVDIVGELTPPPQQSGVFLAPDRLTYAKLAHESEFPSRDFPARSPRDRLF